MRYWILFNNDLYVDYESTSFKTFLNKYLHEYRLMREDLKDAPIAFGNFYNRVAFIMYNTAEINEVVDLLSNYFYKVYRSDQYDIQL